MGETVRIAVSGTHATGKTTLVEALAEQLPGHSAAPEPYERLIERGYAFDHPPSVEDYVAQLRQSLATLRRRAPNVIFDRCPLDFLAYIDATRGGERFNLETWRRPIEEAMASLDLVIAVRIDPAHDPIDSTEDAAFRAGVDDRLRELIDDDELDLCGEVAVLPLAGPWDTRLTTVLARIEALRR